jgi:hypothetical protein
VVQVLVGEPGQGEGELQVRGVVHHDLLGRDRGGVDHGEPEPVLDDGVAAQAVLSGGAEPDGLAVADRDEPLVLGLGFAQDVEAAVVEDGAVLEDLDQGAAAVRGGRAEDLGEALAVGVQGAADEAGLGAEANEMGLNGWSSEPMGVDLVTFPTSLVGEYWPFVRP